MNNGQHQSQQNFEKEKYVTVPHPSSKFFLLPSAGILHEQLYRPSFNIMPIIIRFILFTTMSSTESN